MTIISTHIKTAKTQTEKNKKAFLQKQNAHQKAWVNGAKKR